MSLISRVGLEIRERRGEPQFHPVGRNEASNEASGLPVAAAEAAPPWAAVVEGHGALEAVQVGKAQKTGFTHFLDGIQRARLAYYEAMIPVFYGYLAAAIRVRRQDRKLHTWRIPLIQESLFFPFAHIDPTPKLQRGMDVVDTYPCGEQVDEHPSAMLEKARKVLRSAREKLESRLARQWIDSNPAYQDSWLIVDGSLREFVDSVKLVNVIGLIKSHQRQYFPFEDQKKILALSVGERSSVFQVEREREDGPYSWYLRMYPSHGRDIYFGLIRVEASPVSEIIERADEISRWLLAERNPLSLPDNRWDRLIYPIHDCEQYLRSIAPTRTVLDAECAGM